MGGRAGVRPGLVAQAVPAGVLVDVPAVDAPAEDTRPAGRYVLSALTT
ncbi:MAG: hypothetical protein VX608_17140 [Chloroflexota bacterium]|jgi:hypothetical protein|nr:hypothetical protein [Chloroflexota bacterium]